MRNTKRVIRFTHTPSDGVLSVPLLGRDHKGFRVLYFEIHRVPLTAAEIRARDADIIEVGGKQPPNPPPPPTVSAHPPAPPASSGNGPYRCCDRNNYDR